MNNSNDFEAIFPEENEEKALTDRYFELYELLGAEAMMKLYDHYHGDKIDCPMKLYRAEYVADLAEQEKDRRDSPCGRLCAEIHREPYTEAQKRVGKVIYKTRNLCYTVINYKQGAM